MAVLLTVGIFSVTGCSQQPKAADSKAAIEQAKVMETVEEKTKYLVSEANAFVNNKNFDEAVKTAKYVLSNLDAESQEAKSIIEKATAEIKKMAEQKAEELKKSLLQ